MVFAILIVSTCTTSLLRRLLGILILGLTTLSVVPLLTWLRRNRIHNFFRQFPILDTRMSTCACNLLMQDPTEKHCSDVGILAKYKDNNNNSNVPNASLDASDQSRTQSPVPLGRGTKGSGIIHCLPHKSWRSGVSAHVQNFSAWRTWNV